MRKLTQRSSRKGEFKDNSITDKDKNGSVTHNEDNLSYPEESLSTRALGIYDDSMNCMSQGIIMA